MLHDDAPLLRLCPPQPPHQLVFAPLQQLLVVHFGDVLRRTLCGLGRLGLLLLVRCALSPPLKPRAACGEKKKKKKKKKSTVFAEFLRARHQTEPRNTPGNNSDPKRYSGSPHHPLLCPRDYIAFMSAVPLSHAHAAAPISARCSAAVRPPLEHRSARRCVFGCAFGRLGGAVSLQVHAGRFCALPLLSAHCRCPTAAEQDRRRGETARRGCRCTAGEPGC